MQQRVCIFNKLPNKLPGAADTGSPWTTLGVAEKLLTIWDIIPYDSIIHSFQKGSISNILHVFEARGLEKAVRDVSLKGSGIHTAVMEEYFLRARRIGTPISQIFPS